MSTQTIYTRSPNPTIPELASHLEELDKLLHEKDRAVREMMAEKYDHLQMMMDEKEKGVRALVDERADRIGERFEADKVAVGMALAASEKLTTSVFTASEKAVEKAEAAQREYNIRSNEFRGQLEDQAKTLLPRSEADVRDERVREQIGQVVVSMGVLKDDVQRGIGEIRDSLRKDLDDVRDSLRKDLDDLRASRDMGTGKEQGVGSLLGGAGAVVGILIALAALIVALLRHA